MAVHDLSAVFRGLRREPRFAALAVLTFALGIGAATAIFTVVNRVVLRSVPYPNPDRIVYLGWSWKGGGHSSALSPRAFEFWRDQTRVFDGVATYREFTTQFGNGRSESDALGLRVTSDFFKVTGAKPALGRAFTPDEYALGAPHVAMLSHAFWESRFGLDPKVLEQQIPIEGVMYTVVGIMQPAFRMADDADQPQVLVPLALGPTEFADRGYNYQVVARLKPRVTLSAARTDVAAVLPRFRTAYPDLIEKNDAGVVLAYYRDMFLGDLQTELWVLFAATGFVLLLTCANVANLLLGRAIRRRREIAIRSALGATPGRLVRLFVTEGLVIGVLAAALGIGISLWSLHALLGLAPQMLPIGEEPKPDGWVLAFSAGLAIAGGIVLGLVHAIPTLRTHRYQGRLPGVLIAAESALAIVLLAGAGLLITSLTRLLAVDPGFSQTGIVTARIPRAPPGYDSIDAVWSFDQRVLARLRATPGVRTAASVSALPFENGWNLSVTMDGNPDATLGAVWWYAMSPDYFATLGITLVRGRDFSETDTRGSPGVIIINQSLANRFWPGQDPIGHRIAVGQFRGKSMVPSMDEPPREIVGVIADTRQLELTRAAVPMMFVPQTQVPAGLVTLPALLVRTTNGALTSAAIARAIDEIDPRMPPPHVETIHQRLAQSVGPERFLAVLMGLFAALALIVTCVGIYGVTAYAVASRTRDIGIRMALGAPGSRVVRRIVGQGMLPVVVGLSLGIAAALFLTRVLTSLLYGVAPRDPATLALVTVILIGAALLGNWLPARRAARIDPLIALRSD
jgi:putative ABC transport system permease protein